MKKAYTTLFIFGVLFFAPSISTFSQTNEQTKQLAKNWLNISCIEPAVVQTEIENLIANKNELSPYFENIISNGVESNLITENKIALGELYDKNIKMLNENKPAWVTAEYERKIRSVSKEQFVAGENARLILNYKVQATKALEIMNTTTGINNFFNGVTLTSYPNPVSTGKTTIEYSLEKNEESIILTILDQTGRKLIEKKYDNQAAGQYKVDIDVNNLATGTYFYQLNTTSKNITKTFVVANN